MSSLTSRLAASAVALAALLSASPAAAAEVPLRPVVSPSEVTAPGAAWSAASQAERRAAFPDPAPTAAALQTRNAAPRASSRIVAGAAVDITAAPWQVYLYAKNGDFFYECGGSIVNATTVITAAHCLTGRSIGAMWDDNGVGVLAGVSHLDVDVQTDQPQVKRAISARIHPSYGAGLTARAPEGDIAVITLDSALSFATAQVKPIALPTSTLPSIDGEPVPAGPAARVTGFGLQARGVESNGQLYALDTSIVDPDFCGPFPNATGLCALTTTGSSCSGDSGSGLVAGGQLIGVVSSGVETCAPGSWNRFTSLLAPENRLFIDGNPAPPRAPRQTRPLAASASAERVGGVLTCSGGAFDGGASTKYLVTNDEGQRLAAKVGASLTYVIAPSDAGRKLLCRAFGSNAGGVAQSEQLISGVVAAAPSAPTPAPIPTATPTPVAAPELTDTQALKRMRVQVEAPKSARRGKLFRVRVRFDRTPENADYFAAGVTGPTLRANPLRSAQVTRTASAEDGEFEATYRFRMPSRAIVGKRYRVRIRAFCQLKNNKNEVRQLTVYVRAKR